MTTEQMKLIIDGDEATLATFGLTWVTDTVNKQPGGNGAQKTTVSTDAQILTLVDVTAFLDNFPNGGEILKGIANGTSLKVLAQGINRDNPTKSIEWRRTAILNRFLGVRNSPTVVKVVEKIVEVTVVKHSLPGGATYEGTDLTEYQAAYIAALVDMGVEVSVAQGIASNITL